LIGEEGGWRGVGWGERRVEWKEIDRERKKVRWKGGG
jgi:hypothetical protein